MKNVALSLVVLKSAQVDALRMFYSAVGIELVEEQHGKGPLHYAGHVGDAVLELYPLTDDVLAADTTTRLGFTVDRLINIIDAVKALEAVVVTEPRATEWGLRAVVRDPDGRSVELVQR